LEGVEGVAGKEAGQLSRQHLAGMIPKQISGWSPLPTPHHHRNGECDPQ